METEKEPQKIEVDLDRYEAAILDMDGVVTFTARAHAAVWKKMFNKYLKERARREQRDYRHRSGRNPELEKSADIVVSDLSELRSSQNEG